MDANTQNINISVEIRVAANNLVGAVGNSRKQLANNKTIMWPLIVDY